VLPQRYGGYGLDYLSLGLVCEELEYVDTVYRTVLSGARVDSSAWPVYGRPEDQKPNGSSRWLGKKRPLRLDGTNAGSDVASMQSTAKAHGDG